MDLLQLSYFRAVARTEHITRAAKELRIAQPSLSMMISKLEEDLGVPLFDRQGRNIKLNAYGKVFLKYANESLNALEQGKRELKEMAGLEQGELSLVTFSLMRFKDMLGSFMTQFPQVNFRIFQDGIFENRIQLLEQGVVDFYIGHPAVRKPGIINFTLCTDELMLTVSRSHRFAGRDSICLNEVWNEPFIGLKKGTSARELQDGFCKEAGFEPRVVCEVDEPAAISSLVSTGLGIAFAPPNMENLDSSVDYLRIEEPKCIRPLQLAWLESRYLSKAAIAFKEMVIRYFDSK